MTMYPAMCLNDNGEFIFVHPKDIMYIQADGSYSHVVLKAGKKITICKKIKELEATLPDDFFFRVHQSFLVNLMYLVSYRNDKSQEIELVNGATMQLSRRKKAEFMALFVKF